MDPGIRQTFITCRVMMAWIGPMLWPKSRRNPPHHPETNRPLPVARRFRRRMAEELSLLQLERRFPRPEGFQEIHGKDSDTSLI
jgi:hypothetical protein